MSGHASSLTGWLDRRLKRALDVVGAATGLIVLSPIMAAAAVAIRRDLGAPVLFRQTRPGFGGRPFELVKFRTMRLETASERGPASDGMRLTPLGARLRSLSIDELPTLWNVLRGDMSLVGPRPLLMQYLDRYTPEQARRHEVLPGVTGWAQVHGRNAIGWEEKFALDVWYVDHRTVWLDLEILARTLLGVLRREGISAPGTATMPLFEGSAAEAV